MRRPPPASRALLAGIARTPVLHVANGHRQAREDEVVVEEPLEIRVNGEPFAVVMRTPGQDFELVSGLLFAEGLLETKRDLFGISHCGKLGEEGAKNVVEVRPAPGSPLARVGEVPRSTAMSSACGICGRVTIEDLLARLGSRTLPKAEFSAEFLAALPEELAQSQANFARTGGLHAVGAAPAGGALCLVREDVGRHNAVDKVVGRLFLDGELPFSENSAPHALVVSGRASFEIVQKAVTAGFAAVVSVSAPSSLAIETARRTELVLLGFTRGGSCNVYSGEERLR